MAKISEITSDGGDRNKKPKEEQNQNEKPQQQVQNPPNLPEEVKENIIARIPRARYTYLCLASKAFRQMFTTPRLFETRSRLGRTECVLYAFIVTTPYLCPRWYILHRRNKSLQLSMIGSLPSMNLGSAVVTIGYEMYIIGGKLHSSKPSSSVFAIDCRFHTWRCLPDMRRARNYAAAGVIGGKIYVIGGCTKRDEDWVEVFDVNKNIWQTVPGQNPNTLHLDKFFGPIVVMQEKIYIWDGLNCLAYEPGRRHWESWGVGAPQNSIWPLSSCVVDGMLYTINHMCSLGSPIAVYDPRDVVWRPVKGIRRSDFLNLSYYDSKMANFGGKLVILSRGQRFDIYDYYKDTDIGCIVIALEKRVNGEIWGNVESNSRVLTFSKFPFIEHSRTVTL